MAKPTASWDRLGDRFYRKIQLYTDVFDPDVELENYLISGAPYSGALALHRDQTKIHTYRHADAAKSTIDIYTCAGKLIRQLTWDKGPIVGLGWSDEETLVVVTRNGTVRCYQDLSDDCTPFSLGSIAEEYGVVSCRFWLSGFVALLGNNQLIAVSRYDEPRPKVLATPPSEEVLSWALIPPSYSLSRTVEVLLAIGQSIYVVDTTDAEERVSEKGPFHHIRVSPNGRFVALYTGDGKVWVISADFQEQLSEYDTRARTVPKDVQWCGNDAVALAWEDEVHLLGPAGSAVKYYYDAWVHLVADVDGIRLFTNDVCEFLQKVPDASEDVFRVNSQLPAAVLLDAANHLEAKSPKADDAIQLIKPQLDDAIEGCISAAGAEYSSHWQKQLLRAASFGKTVVDGYDSDEFVAMCETVRVLNAVRFFEVGLPLSHEQYVRLNPERLIARLVNREHYALALRIAEYLRVPTARVYTSWASRKAKVSSEDEGTICKEIVAKLEATPGANYEAIARAAFSEGRKELATGLLEHEVRSGPQVRLLLDMEEDRLALDKAIEAGDTDLVLYVLTRLHKKLPLATFFRTINSRPVATALVESTAREQDVDLLKDLYYQDDRRLDGAMLLFAAALAQGHSPDETAARLKSATKLLADAKDQTATARHMDDAGKLLKRQQALDADPHLVDAESGMARPKLSGLSVNETALALVRVGAGKAAQSLMADFRVPERTSWWLRLRGHVAARAWREIEALGSRSRRSPIGWEPFVYEILNAGNARLAGSFVARCTTLEARERMELYVKCDMLGAAGEEAVKAKDGEWLEGMRDKVVGRDKVEIERCIGLLGKR